MRVMTKSPVAMARAAYQIAQANLPDYSCTRSRKDFTQHQLFAILALRQFFDTDYRGITQLLSDLSDLRQVLELKKIPHFSTLCYAERRILKKSNFDTCCKALSDALETSA